MIRGGGAGNGLSYQGVFGGAGDRCSAEASTSYRAAERATKRPVTLYRSGDYFLQVINEAIGRVFAFEYDLPY